MLLINSAGMPSKTPVDDKNDKNSDDFVPLQFRPFTGKDSRYAISPEVACKIFQNLDLLLDVLNELFNILPGHTKDSRILDK